MSETSLVDSFAGLWSETLDQESPAIPWLWEGYLAPGKVTLLTSLWKAGKSTLVSILLSKLAEGGMLAGLPVKPGRAIIVSEESVGEWAKRHQTLHFQHSYFLCRPFRGRKPTLEQWLSLLEYVGRMQREHDMNLLVVDTLTTFLPGLNEAAAGPMMQALLPLNDLIERDMNVLLNHHPKKGEVAAGQAARGSGALGSFADIVLEMDRCAHPAEEDRRRKILAFSRSDLTPRQLVIELNREGTDYITHGTFQDDEFLQNWDKVKMVLEDAKDWRTRRQILEDWPADFAKPNDITLLRWLGRAVALSQLLQQGTGKRNDPFRYALPGQEDVWRQDPLYEFKRKYEEGSRLIQDMLAKPLPRPWGK